MKFILKFFLSLKLTVTLLALMMVLVFAGTLAQVDQGLWAVVDQYFRCFIARIDLQVFFPRSIDVPNVKLFFPGGFLIGLLLSINLVTVHFAGFKILANGRRKWIGLILLALGIVVTAGVMFGWGTASVAATEDDAFWRVFFRLGRGTLAAVVLYVACVFLYAKRAGMVLLHGGILFLLIGETITALFAVEATMTIPEGETVHYVSHARKMELAFVDQTNPNEDWVTVIPHRALKAGKTITQRALPFDVRVHQFMPSSTEPIPLEQVPPQLLENYPVYLSYPVYIEPKRTSGMDQSIPTVDVELMDRATGKSMGRYLFSRWFYPFSIQVGGKSYEVALRNRREYLKTDRGHPFSIKLLDFVHEKYEGTQMAKDFSSRIRLINEGEGVDRELKIWMNNPLRYAHRTFYQSSFLPDESGTVLQVVRNDSWMIPYLSCMIVFVGMAAHFIQSFGRFLRRQKEEETEGGTA